MNLGIYFIQISLSTITVFVTCTRSRGTASSAFLQAVAARLVTLRSRHVTVSRTTGTDVWGYT